MVRFALSAKDEDGDVTGETPAQVTEKLLMRRSLLALLCLLCAFGIQLNLSSIFIWTLPLHSCLVQAPR